eukprot:Phypoly_transcript_24146.p1 GENE.Phypoly_transcript_24146~~Phypoly_transcript_24146.p1  ORF type:complete len:153 (+),score=13.89 Phypoly_transcript_24146:38-460(+)
MADFYRDDDITSRIHKGVVDQAIVGDYDYVKGGSSETYTQELSLKADGTATYKQFHETQSEAYTRTGRGKWTVLYDSQLVLIHFHELKKDTKVKNKVAISGLKDEVKVDHDVALDIKYTDLSKAQPSGPSAPKSRWRKKN